MTYIMSLLLSLLFLAPNDIVGVARVIDGDSLEVGGVTIRLAGIDAPEADQACGVIRCGPMSTQHLTALTSGTLVACTPTGDMTYGRTVASCRTAAAGDLGAAMVRTGHAMDEPRYSPDYRDLTVQAEAQGLGMWAGTVMPAWEWRAQATPASVPDTCNIKGNITDNGHIYHLPGGRNYDETRITPSRGERWFCSVAQAEASGWRAARR